MSCDAATERYSYREWPLIVLLLCSSRENDDTFSKGIQYNSWQSKYSPFTLSSYSSASAAVGAHFSSGPNGFSYADDYFRYSNSYYSAHMEDQKAS